jgi:hypothetical protein
MRAGQKGEPVAKMSHRARTGEPLVAIETPCVSKWTLRASSFIQVEPLS